MSVVIVFVFLVGAVVGAVLLVAVLNFWADSDDAKRRMARAHAEQRVHDAQVKAMVAMADATEQAVAGSASAHGWPSEVIEGTATTIMTTKD